MYSIEWSYFLPCYYKLGGIPLIASSFPQNLFRGIDVRVRVLRHATHPKFLAHPTPTNVINQDRDINHTYAEVRKYKTDQAHFCQFSEVIQRTYTTAVTVENNASHEAKTNYQKVTLNGERNKKLLVLKKGERTKFYVDPKNLSKITATSHERKREDKEDMVDDVESTLEIVSALSFILKFHKCMQVCPTLLFTRTYFHP